MSDTDEDIQIPSLLLFSDALVGGESLDSIEERAQRVTDLYDSNGILLATVSPLVSRAKLFHWQGHKLIC